MFGERTGDPEVDYSAAMKTKDREGWEAMLELVQRWKEEGARDWFNPVFWGNGTDPKDVNYGRSGEPKLKWLGGCGNLNATSDECFKFYK